MSKWNNRRKINTILCQILLCILLPTGCGQAEAGPPVSDENTGTDLIESAEDMPDTRTAREIMEQLLGDGDFEWKVWVAAESREEDTEELILQKLEQCESLTLNAKVNDQEFEKLYLLPNLQSLVIEYPQISDFTPIAQLSQLKHLYVEFSLYQKKEVVDFSFLAEMDTITELFLIKCDLKDASFLEKMPQLQCLSLYHTPVDDLAVLENMPELVELSLCGNREAKHIETVGSLLKMRDLGLQDCGISDISFLSSLSELQGVNLNENAVADLSPLAGLSRLERLGLVENEVSDLSPIAGLSQLYDLALDGNQISDISVLEKLPRLNQVGLSNNRIKDFSPLADKPELLYVSASGNPCTDLRPVMQAPFLYAEGGAPTEQQLEIVKDWMEAQRPDVEEYECISYSEADLNGDGLTDAAFVVNGEFMEGGEYAANNYRRMFILLQQRNGSWSELENDIRIGDPDSGGMRGDSYRGMWMGDGLLLHKEEWGSSSGTAYTEIYCYRHGSLELVQTVAVDDYNWAYGYDVTVSSELTGTWNRYAIAREDYRMVRVDLANAEYPRHWAFPRLNLFYADYIIYPEGLPVNMDAAAALEYFLQYVQAEVEQKPIPYTEWQKEGYELLKGVKLPDYYYVVPKAGDEELEDEKRDHIYYFDLERDEGEFYHIIRYRRNGQIQDYRINDATGDLE